MKVYLVYKGRRDGGYGTTNEIEEQVEKVFSTIEKAINWVKDTSGHEPDEYGYVKFNRLRYSDTDIDYEYYDVREYDVE